MNTRQHNLLRFVDSKYGNTAFALALGIEMFIILTCSQYIHENTIVLTPIDSCIQEENSNFMIPDGIIDNITLHKDHCMIVSIHDNTVVSRSRKTGKILISYEIPLSVTDSLFPVGISDELPIEGWLADDSTQVLALSRHVLPIDRQELLLRHRVNSVTFESDTVPIINVEIAGMVRFNYNNEIIRGPLWQRALLFYDLVHLKLIKIVKLPLVPAHYIYTSSFANRNGNLVISGAVDKQWIKDRRSRFTQNTMCKYDLRTNKTEYFAPRDSGNIKYVSEDPFVWWIAENEFWFSNGDDDRIMDEQGRTVCRLPDDSPHGENIRPERRSIRGFQAGGRYICAYVTWMLNGYLHHGISVFHAKTLEYEGSWKYGRMAMCCIVCSKMMTFLQYIKREKG